MLAVLAAAAIAAATPPGLTVPASAALILQAHGRGVQIYVCAVKSDEPGRYAWRLKAPSAELFGPAGKLVARHYAGPTWEGLDGGKVVGEVRTTAASPDPAAIDWLLLSAKSANGVGVLGKTAFVQRTKTMGGRAPEGGCSSASMGTETSVGYEADYSFYAAP